MTSAHAEKLALETRCPCCGDPRMPELSERRGAIAITVFACGAAFHTTNGEIAVQSPCTAGSHLAARLYNEEVRGKARPDVSPPCGQTVDNPS